MSKLRKHMLAVAFVSGLVGLASAAPAQQAADPHHPPAAAPAQPQAPARGMMGMMGPGMMGPGMMGPGMMGMMAGCPMMGDGASPHAEGRAAFIRAELGITDAQKAVWDAYAAALKKNLASMHAGQQRMARVAAAKTPAERLEAQIALMEPRLTALKDLKVPLAALYGALSPEQKAKADQLLTTMGCMM